MSPIVTDSTAYLPPLTMERHGITAVPLTVVLGDRAFEEGTEISTRSLALALPQRALPVTTSRPSPQLFAETYRRVAESGATGIVSLHLSAELSGTYDAAVLAAREAPVPVRVVDTGMIAMALGFCALAAAETAEAGGTIDEAVTAAEKRGRGHPPPTSTSTPSTICAGAGRIGAAQALLGSALAVKPLLQLEGGRIEPLEKVRTASKAIARLEEIVADRAGSAQSRHRRPPSLAPERAEALAGAPAGYGCPGLAGLHVSEVGAVIGAAHRARAVGGCGLAAVTVAACGVRGVRRGR
ncbi:DegV family protein [Streptomyces sp. L7]